MYCPQPEHTFKKLVFYPDMLMTRVNEANFYPQWSEDWLNCMFRTTKDRTTAESLTQYLNLQETSSEEAGRGPLNTQSI